MFLTIYQLMQGSFFGVKFNVVLNFAQNRFTNRSPTIIRSDSCKSIISFLTYNELYELLCLQVYQNHTNKQIVILIKPNNKIMTS